MAPTLLGLHPQLMNHGQRRQASAATFGAIGPVTNRRKGRFNRVSRPQMYPMLRRKIVESEEHFFIFGQTFTGLFTALAKLHFVKTQKFLISFTRFGFGPR